jgi:hypothetical protein
LSNPKSFKEIAHDEIDRLLIHMEILTALGENVFAHHRSVNSGHLKGWKVADIGMTRHEFIRNRPKR